MNSKATHEYEITNKQYKVENHIKELNQPIAMNQEHNFNNFNDNNNMNADKNNSSYAYLINEIDRKGYCNYAEYLAQIEYHKAIQLNQEKERLVKERADKTKVYLKQYKVNNQEKEKKLNKIRTEKKAYKKNQEEYNKLLKEKAITNYKKKNNISTCFDVSNIGDNSKVEIVNCFENDEEKKEMKGKVYITKHSKNNKVASNTANNSNNVRVVDQMIDEYIENNNSNENYINNRNQHEFYNSNNIMNNMDNVDVDHKSKLNKNNNNAFENVDFEYIVNIKNQMEELIIDSLNEKDPSSNVFRNNLETNSKLDNINYNINNKNSIDSTDKVFNNINSNNNNNTVNIENRIRLGINNVKEFRKRGFINQSDLEEEQPSLLNIIPENVTIKNKYSHLNINKYANNNNSNISDSIYYNNNMKPKENHSSKARVFRNELEKRRYVKALKNIMIEKFNEKNIVIPNICSCGQLQKNLDTLIEKGNVSVLSIVNTDCANNCIYYNNSKEYKKALNDIIASVKNLKFDVFH